MTGDRCSKKFGEPWFSQINKSLAVPLCYGDVKKHNWQAIEE